MSAEAKALLDELMGRSRNLDPSQQPEDISWNSDDVSGIESEGETDLSKSSLLKFRESLVLDQMKALIWEDYYLGTPL